MILDSVLDRFILDICGTCVTGFHSLPPLYALETPPLSISSLLRQSDMYFFSPCAYQCQGRSTSSRERSIPCQPCPAHRATGLFPSHVVADAPLFDLQHHSINITIPRTNRCGRLIAGGSSTCLLSPHRGRVPCSQTRDHRYPAPPALWFGPLAWWFRLDVLSWVGVGIDMEWKWL